MLKSNSALKFTQKCAGSAPNLNGRKIFRQEEDLGQLPDSPDVRGEGETIVPLSPPPARTPLTLMNTALRVPASVRPAASSMDRTTARSMF